MTYLPDPPDMNPPDEETGPTCPVCETEDCRVINGGKRGHYWWYTAECINHECGHFFGDDNFGDNDF